MKFWKLYDLYKTTYPITNTPNSEALDNLDELIDNILDPCRFIFGEMIIVDSCYRSKELNNILGGSPNSQHLLGQAADIHPFHRDENSLQRLFSIIKLLDFDQLIIVRKYDYRHSYIYSYLHVSYNKEGNRNEVIENAIKNRFPKNKDKNYNFKQYINN